MYDEMQGRIKSVETAARQLSDVELPDVNVGASQESVVNAIWNIQSTIKRVVYMLSEIENDFRDDANYISQELHGAVMPDMWFLAADEAEKLGDILQRVDNDITHAARQIEQLDDDLDSWWETAKRLVSNLRLGASFESLISAMKAI